MLVKVVSKSGNITPPPAKWIIENFFIMVINLGIKQYGSKYFYSNIYFGNTYNNKYTVYIQ